MSIQKETRPATVTNKSKQAGEIRDRWSWVEPTVWTDRMLTALEKGVKGGTWFSLIDKVFSTHNLYASFKKVKKNQGNSGVDRQSIQAFDRKLDENIPRLSELIRSDQYRPKPVRRTYIVKMGSKEKRPLGIPTVRDRTAQGALRHVLEPIFEKEFSEQSYGFRPGRGCKDALRKVDRALKEGHTHVVDADLKSYFDTIPHEQLLDRIRLKVADSRVIRLIDLFLKQGVMENMKCWISEQGTPQGAVVSPLLSNIYLDPLDHQMEQKGYLMIRYADDFVVLCKEKEEAELALQVINEWVAKNGLTLHPEKTKIVDAFHEGFDFLGYHFEEGKRRPRKKSLKKLKNSIRTKTKRCNGNSLEFIIANVNRTLVGWFGYYKHSHWYTFTSLDGWIRMRLRSILRKRKKRRGRGRGADHYRWPNAYFAELGLFSLTAAHAEVCQSLKVNHQLESRMRENRTYGSEGGGSG